jgi:hypothetical protein
LDDEGIHRENLTGFLCGGTGGKREKTTGRKQYGKNAPHFAESTKNTTAAARNGNKNRKRFSPIFINAPLIFVNLCSLYHNARIDKTAPL